jgi:hypothetical protein
MEELPEFALKIQFYDKVTSTYLIKVDISFITTGEVIDQLKDVVTPVNTKTSNLIMMSQENHNKTKPNINKDKFTRHL